MEGTDQICYVCLFFFFLHEAIAVLAFAGVVAIAADAAFIHSKRRK
jgi:hypothetical protein